MDVSTSCASNRTVILIPSGSQLVGSVPRLASEYLGGGEILAPFFPLYQSINKCQSQPNCMYCECRLPLPYLTGSSSPSLTLGSERPCGDMLPLQSTLFQTAVCPSVRSCVPAFPQLFSVPYIRYLVPFLPASGSLVLFIHDTGSYRVHGNSMSFFFVFP